MAKVVETPLMKQYFEVKAKHPDAILLFRVGDFYEMYGEDAVIGAEILGIVQTKRANGVGTHIEMAGFPHHALDTYLPKLVRAGKRVAICDQLEDPKLTKKLVKRGITELVTPGVSINDNILNHKENNFLASIHFGKSTCGIAFLDISTGEFLTAEGTPDYIDKLLNNFSPKEVLIERNNKKHIQQAKKDIAPYHITHASLWSLRHVKNISHHNLACHTTECDNNSYTRKQGPTHPSEMLKAKWKEYYEKHRAEHSTHKSFFYHIALHTDKRV